MYTVLAGEVDRLVANNLDFNHDAVQKFAEMQAGVGGRLTKAFEWPADRVIGRGYEPGRTPLMHDDTVVRTVLKYDPARQQPYFVLTSYPIGEMG